MTLVEGEVAELLLLRGGVVAERLSVVLAVTGRLRPYVGSLELPVPVQAALQLHLIGSIVGLIVVPDLENRIEEGVVDIQVRDPVRDLDIAEGREGGRARDLDDPPAAVIQDAVLSEGSIGLKGIGRTGPEAAGRFDSPAVTANRLASTSWNWSLCTAECR
jgi:hypothetical protein